MKDVGGMLVVLVKQQANLSTAEEEALCMRLLARNVSRMEYLKLSMLENRRGVVEKG